MYLHVLIFLNIDCLALPPKGATLPHFWVTHTWGLDTCPGVSCLNSNRGFLRWEAWEWREPLLDCTPLWQQKPDFKAVGGAQALGGTLSSHSESRVRVKPWRTTEGGHFLRAQGTQYYCFPFPCFMVPTCWLPAFLNPWYCPLLHFSGWEKLSMAFVVRP